MMEGILILIVSLFAVAILIGVILSPIWATLLVYFLTKKRLSTNKSIFFTILTFIILSILVLWILIGISNFSLI